MIWDFDRSLTNALGGEYNAYARNPSWARTYLDPNVHRSSAGHSLRVSAHREAEGFCGVWLEFFPGSRLPRRYLDAGPYRYLSFWIKGQKGGEDFDITLADVTWQKHEESNPTRPLQAYLPHGVTTEWQEVLIPLADFRGLNKRQLAQLTLSITAPGDYRFYLDDVAFKADKSAAPAAAGSPAAGAQAGASGSDHRALWVWNTQNFFDSSRGTEEAVSFFEFCSREGIGEIYLSLILSRPTGSDPHSELREAEHYQEFLARAHRQGLKVEGLAGTPEWAARENHPHALAVVDAVLAFNRAVPETARFDGIHFDVEPYSLLGYSDSVTRTELLKEFLEMVAKCAERARLQGKLRFDCDVPAWFYPAGELERQQLNVNFKGEEKTVGEHLTDLLDTVTIMDYRNEADGAGGIVAAGVPALAYAASRNKKILVGFETSLEADSTVYFVCGLPVEEFRRRLASSDLRNRIFLGGWRLSTFSDDVNIHIGLSAPPELEGPRRAEFEKSLALLARELGAASDPDRFSPAPILEEARAALEQNPEWKGFETFEITDLETHCKFAGFRTVHRMLPKITFYKLGREVFDEETRSVVEWLSPYSSFAGIAVHFYDSYRSLVEGK